MTSRDIPTFPCLYELADEFECGPGLMPKPTDRLAFIRQA